MFILWVHFVFTYKDNDSIHLHVYLKAKYFGVSIDLTSLGTYLLSQL